MQRTDINFILRDEDGKEHVQQTVQTSSPIVHHEKEPRKKIKFLIVFVVVAILLLTGYVAKAVWQDNFNDSNAYDLTTLEPKKPEGLFQKLKYFVFSKDVQLQGERNDRINVLLLGMGGPGHDGPYLTDTIIIGSMKPSTGEVAMMSIPRDLGVDIPGQGMWKINHANSFGETKQPGWGGAFATQVISDTFNIEIPYYIRIDFEAFKEIIDEVGGVNINVERSFTDYEYPAPNDQYKTVSFQKGEQKMNGEKALEYARSRHGNNGEGSDFARSRRQQQILLALKEKVFSFSTLANPIKINNIINSLDKHITTNMEFADIVTLLKTVKEMDTSNIKNFVLDNSPNGYLVSGTSASGAYILSPKTGNFNDINNLLANLFEAEPQQTAPVVIPTQEIPDYSGATIEIQNGTWVVGLAARIEKKLEEMNFTIGGVGNTEERPVTVSGIYNVSDNIKPEIANALKEELHISIRKPPEGLIFSSSTDILVILGTDFAE